MGPRRASTFDLAILDMHMPDLDGIELAEAMREAPSADGRAPIPVLVLSSVGTRERRDDAVAAELTKPVKPSALLDAVMTVLAPDADRPAARPAPGGGRPPGRRPPAADPRGGGQRDQPEARRSSCWSGWATPADVAGNGFEVLEGLEAAATTSS